MSPLPIDEVHVRNFKAIRDSGPLKLGGLTVFIGNNGSGKSSVLEALETVQVVTHSGLDVAMQRFRGMAHIRNKSAVPADPEPGEARPDPDPMIIAFKGSNDLANRSVGGVPMGGYSAETRWAERDGGNQILIENEMVNDGAPWVRGPEGVVIFNRQPGGAAPRPRLSPGRSMFTEFLGPFISSWQFLTLQPDAMGPPRPQGLSGGLTRLNRDGSNVAEYLAELRRLDTTAFTDLVQALQFVLPYAVDFQPALTSEIERSVYLQMKEAGFTIPGWLLSSGTLRIAALLALFRSPNAPKVLFIEELENGLDPRTIGLVVEEILSAVHSGRQQVVITTHSPYLLDLFPLESIVVVDRVDGAPKFWRPNDDADIRKWKDKFAPGRMYATGTFSRGKPA